MCHITGAKEELVKNATRRTGKGQVAQVPGGCINNLEPYKIKRKSFQGFNKGSNIGCASESSLPPHCEEQAFWQTRLKQTDCTKVDREEKKWRGKEVSPYI